MYNGNKIVILIFIKHILSLIRNKHNLEDIETIKKVYEIMEEDDFVNYTCPIGYIFNATHDISVSAICKNQTWIYDFDPSKMCVRK